MNMPENAEKNIEMLVGQPMTLTKEVKGGISVSYYGTYLNYIDQPEYDLSYVEK